jgi:hypothetical protein
MDGPQDPSGLKTLVGDASRNLGQEGKKKGLTTTMPLVLGLLQAEGKIIRKPLNGRLDSLRYAYARWGGGITLSTPEEAYSEFAKRFFKWIGPATLTEFAGIAGISNKGATAACEGLNLQPIDGTGLLLPASEHDAFHSFKAPKDPVYRLVCSVDGIVLHRWNIRPLLDEADYGQTMHSDGKTVEVGQSREIFHHAILASGRIVGFWEYDSEAGEIVRHLFIPTNSDVEAEINRVTEFARDQLGDVRSFSLDSPESRKPKLAALRAANG